MPTEYKWSRVSRNFDLDGQTGSNPTVQIEAPLWASTLDESVILLVDDIPMHNDVGDVFIISKRDTIINADGSEGGTVLEEYEFVKYLDPDGPDAGTDPDQREVVRKRTNGGAWSHFQTYNNHIDNLDFSFYYQGFTPNTYEVRIGYKLNGDPETVVLAGKIDIRGLEIRKIKPDVPLNPEEQEEIALSFEVYALPEEGEGRAVPEGWCPPGDLSWRIGLAPWASTPVIPGSFPLTTANSSGRIATIAATWDGKISAADSYARGNSGLEIDVVSESMGTNLGNFYRDNDGLAALYSRDCCTLYTLREASTAIAAALFSAGPFSNLTVGNQSLDAARTASSMGYGWSTLGSAKLTELGSGDLIYRDEHGFIKRWKSVSGIYVATSKDNYAKAEAGGSSAFRLLFKDQSYRDFNSSGKLVLEGDRNGNEITLTYSGGHLATASDGRGRTLYYGYGSRTDGQPETIRADHPSTGRLVQLAYYPSTAAENLRDRLMSFTDAIGGVTEFEYDSAGRLSKRTDVRPVEGDFVTEYLYDSYGQLETEIFNGVIGKVYSNNRIWTVPFTDGSPTPEECGRDITFIRYPETGNITYSVENQVSPYGEGVGCFTESENRETTFVHEDTNNPHLVTQRIDDNGAITNFVYKANGDLRSVEDTQGNITTYYYAEDIDTAPINPKHQNLLRKIQRADVTVGGVPVTYPMTELEYDANGNLERIIDAQSNVMEMAYSADGLVTSVTNRNGHTTEMVYEGTAFDGSRRRLLQVKVPKGLTSTDGFRTVTLDYDDPDNLDNVTSVTDDLGNTVSTVYDALDRVTEITDARGKVSRYTFVDGILDEVETPANNGSAAAARFIKMIHDSFGRLQEVKRDISASAQETRVKYEYTPFSEVAKLIRLKNAVEKAFEFSYDALGRVVSAKDPLDAEHLTAWESACPGNALTTARGVRRKATVDNLCRLSVLETGLPAEFDPLELESVRSKKQLFYDELGRLVKTQQKDHQGYGSAILGIDLYGEPEEVSFEYNSLDRLVKMTFHDGSEMLWEHDAEGNVTKVVDPTGKVTRYVYYRDNLLYQVIIERPAQDDRVFTYSYDLAGRLLEIEYPADTEVVAKFDDGTSTPGSGWDPNGNLLHLRYEKDGVLIRRFEFSYDDSGNRASQLDVTPTKAVKWLYFYDWLDRLEVVKRAEAVDVASLPGTIPTVSVYSYDASDNRIEFRVEQEDLTYRYVVDDADNLTEIHLTDGTDPEVLIETLEADADGNMLTRTNELTDEVITYAWDDFDRLIKVSSAISGTPTTTVKEHNRYGVDGIRKRKLDKSGNSSTEYTAGISTVASKAASSGSSAPTISYIMGAGQILGAEVNGNFQFWLADHLGSIREIVDDTGTVIRSQEFGEHGQLLNSSGTGTFAPKTYQGGLSVNDDTADSGLYLMGHRHFEPGLLGRFISRDPIGFRGGLNLFNGSSTNPVTFVDPSGKEVDIRFKDGTWGVANNPQELYDLITNADDGSIVTMNIRGHGRPFACGFDPDDEAAPGLDLVSGKKPRITLDLGKPKPTFLADILRPKLTKHSTIWFSTCYSASGSENIARALSELLPGTYVQGNDGSLNSLFGMDLYVAKGKDVAGTSGKVKVYLGGAEVPLTDVIREPYGIHDKASRQ